MGASLPNQIKQGVGIRRLAVVVVVVGERKYYGEKTEKSGNQRG